MTYRYPELVWHANSRRPIWLHDGTLATLIGVHGTRARIDIDGRRRTIPTTDIAMLVRAS